MEKKRTSFLVHLIQTMRKDKSASMGSCSMNNLIYIERTLRPHDKTENASM